MKKLYIMGCGYEGIRLYYHLREEKYEVAAFLDNNKTGDFIDVKILNPADIKEKQGDVCILISSVKFYSEMKEQLIDLGFVEFKDFILGGAFDKKIAVVIGNCYATPVGYYLQGNKEFTDTYYIYKMISLVDNKKQYDFDENLIENCDLCIYQDIRTDNPYGEKFSMEHIESLLKTECKKVVMPNLVGMGKILYPQGDINDEKNLGFGQRFGLFPYKDQVIDNLVNSGYDVEAIIEYIENEKIFDENEINVNFNTIINKFREREKSWTIKIIDFILEIYKDVPVFYDVKHPTDVVMREIANRILMLLNISDCKLIENENRLDAYEMPIYRDVAQAMGLKYWEETYELRKDSKARLCDKMNWKEYVKEYVFWCFEKNGLNI